MASCSPPPPPPQIPPQTADRDPPKENKMDIITLLALLGGLGAGIYIGANWENKRLKLLVAERVRSGGL